MKLLSLPSPLLALLLPLVVHADVEFTSPSAGADVAVGTVNVKWKDSSRPPSIVDLTTYTLDLLVGGNKEGEMLALTNFVSGGSFEDGNEANGTVSAGLSGSAPNGFFFRITSTSSNSGTVINYSDRFTITGLDGSLSSELRNAIEALGGDTNGPPRGGSVPVVSSSSSAAPSTQKTVTVTTPAQNQPTGAPPSSTGGESDGSNAGLIAGVVVAFILFIGAVVGLAIWMFIRRKRRREAAQNIESKSELEQQPSSTSLSELSGDGKVIEAGDGLPPPEMDSMNVRAELAGDYSHGPSEMDGTPVDTPSPLTPIAHSINGEETLDPTLPFYGV